MSENRPLRIFLCHASSDKTAVRFLYNRLKEDGFKPWLDAEDLLPGQNWRMKIRDAFQNSDVVLVCLSCQSVYKEGFVQKEIKFALDFADEKPEGTIFIIPARLEKCTVPEQLSTYQWVDLFEQEEYERLLLALKAWAEQIGVLPPHRKGALTLPHASPKTEKTIPANAGPVPTELKYARSTEGESIRSPIESQPEAKPNLSPKQPYKKHSKGKLNSGIIAITIIIGLATIISAPVGIKALVTFLNHNPAPSPTIMSIPTPTHSHTPILTFTSEPTLINTLPTSIPGIGTTQLRLKDSMTIVNVPAGDFIMGSNNGNLDEQPEHSVYLDAYWIDKTEVTVAMYTKCVSAGTCQEPDKPLAPYMQRLYYGNPYYDNYPIIYINWNDAQTYCQWAGGRLPTEAEWEKAARGRDGWIYPWGNGTPTCSLANYGDDNCGSGGDTLKTVGTYPAGASPYGALDMVGNVREWVNDWYSNTYYSQSLPNNPPGPSKGTDRVILGSGFSDSVMVFRSSYRRGSAPSYSDWNIGFRCSQSNP